jgi:hypothetical protein
MSEKKPRGGGSVKWTTPEQLDYLESLKPAYLAAQNKGGKKFSDFWSTVYEYFFQNWPPDAPTEEEKCKGVTEQDKAKALKSVS